MEPLRRIDIRRERIYTVNRQEGVPDMFQKYMHPSIMHIQHTVYIVFEFNNSEIVTKETRTGLIIRNLSALRVAMKRVLYNTITTESRWKV